MSTRRKTVEYEKNAKKRYACFSKRKFGIFKKSHTICKMTGCGVTILMQTETGNFFHFCSDKRNEVFVQKIIKACSTEKTTSFSLKKGGGGNEKIRKSPMDNFVAQHVTESHNATDSVPIKWVEESSGSTDYVNQEPTTYSMPSSNPSSENYVSIQENSMSSTSPTRLSKDLQDMPVGGHINLQSMPTTCNYSSQGLLETIPQYTFQNDASYSFNTSESYHQESTPILPPHLSHDFDRLSVIHQANPYSQLLLNNQFMNNAYGNQMMQYGMSLHSDPSSIDQDGQINYHSNHSFTHVKHQSPIQESHTLHSYQNNHSLSSTNPIPPTLGHHVHLSNPSHSNLSNPVIPPHSEYALHAAPTSHSIQSFPMGLDSISNHQFNMYHNNQNAPLSHLGKRMRNPEDVPPTRKLQMNSIENPYRSSYVNFLEDSPSIHGFIPNSTKNNNSSMHKLGQKQDVENLPHPVPQSGSFSR